MNNPVNIDKAEGSQVALVGRQTIYMADLDVFGYELLFRDSTTQNIAPQNLDGNLATANVMLNTYFEIGLENVVGNKKAFINLPESFISGEISLPLSNQSVVLEILENIKFTDAIKENLSKLKDQGFTLALDDFEFSEIAVPYLKYVDIVKVDITQLEKQVLEKKIPLLKSKYQLKLLAEKVETKDEFDFCRSLGFDYFQGYFLQKPEIIKGKKLPSNKLAMIQLLNRLQDPDVQVDELSDLLKNDVSLSYKVLRYINSPVFGLSSEVSNLKQAILLLGIKVIKRWVTLIVVAGLSDRSQDIIRLALIRAKMCETLAKALKYENTDDCFLLGLFSLLDAMLNQSLSDVLSSIPMTTDLREGLINRKGKMGKLLNEVIRYEQGEWDSLISKQKLAWAFRSAYIEAVNWAEKAIEGLN